MKKFVAVLAFVLFAGVASAQTVHNPTMVEFTPSPDHAVITSYELDLVRASDNAVIQTLNVGKPAVDADGKCRASVNVQPVTFGTYYAKMRSVASGVVGLDSPNSENWVRSPGAPSKPVVK